MFSFTKKRGKYEVVCYIVDITEKMKTQAFDFAKTIILGENQYSRLLPNTIRESNDVDMQKKVEIQRTYVGKLGELAFLELLNCKKIQVDTTDMFKIYEGEDNVDKFDFELPNKKTIDVKTGFRQNHTRLLINCEQFKNSPKDYYVAVKLDARDTDSKNKLVDLDSISKGLIEGFAEYSFIKQYGSIKDFGEGNAKCLDYSRTMGIDFLLSKFKK